VGSSTMLEVEINEGEMKIKTNMVGNYNLPNILAAVTIGRYFKVEDFKIKLSSICIRPNKFSADAEWRYLFVPAANYS